MKSSPLIVECPDHPNPNNHRDKEIEQVEDDDNFHSPSDLECEENCQCCTTYCQCDSNEEGHTGASPSSPGHESPICDSPCYSPRRCPSPGYSPDASPLPEYILNVQSDSDRSPASPLRYGLDSPTYSPTSPVYWPTSPSYQPMSPLRSPVLSSPTTPNLSPLPKLQPEHQWQGSPPLSPEGEREEGEEEERFENSPSFTPEKLRFALLSINKLPSSSSSSSSEEGKGSRDLDLLAEVANYHRFKRQSTDSELISTLAIPKGSFSYSEDSNLSKEDDEENSEADFSIDLQGMATTAKSDSETTTRTTPPRKGYYKGKRLGSRKNLPNKEFLDKVEEDSGTFKKGAKSPKRARKGMQSRSHLELLTERPEPTETKEGLPLRRSIRNRHSPSAFYIASPASEAALLSKKKVTRRNAKK
jgi:hypothetical protein